MYIINSDTIFEKLYAKEVEKASDYDIDSAIKSGNRIIIVAEEIEDVEDFFSCDVEMLP